MKQLLAPVAAALGVAIIGVLSLWMQQAWLAPSIGSAILIQTLTPEQPTARPWNIGVGQLLGAAGGFVGVYLAAATGTHSFTGGHDLATARVVAATIAILITAGLQLAFKAKSPAGAATALIVAFGLETPNWAGAGRLVVGILLVTGLGEIVRRFLLKMR